MPIDFGAGPGPDLSGIGNAASASKRDTRAPQSLASFSVKRGDNGGVIVCETYDAPKRGGMYQGGGDYKENPFSPGDGASAAAYISGLMGQMGVTPETESPAENAGEGGVEEPAGPPMRGGY